MDSFHETMREAVAEAMRLKTSPMHHNFVVRVEPSRYGGFRVRSIPADLYIDQLTDGPMITDACPRSLAGA